MGDYDPYRGQTAGQVRLLSQDANHRSPEDLRNGLRTFESGKPYVGIFEVVTDAMPDQIFQRKRLGQLDLVLPASLASRHLHLTLRAPEQLVFRIQNFHLQMPASGVGNMVWNRQV